jgi:hypothetical protein
VNVSGREHPIKAREVSMRRMLIAPLLCCILCSSAVGQGVNRGGFTIYGGLTAAGNKSSGGTDGSRTGYNAGIALEFALSHLATFRTSVDYSRVPCDGEMFIYSAELKQNGIVSMESDPARVLMIFGSLEIFFKENRKTSSAYLILGAGYASFSMEKIAFRVRGYNGTFREAVRIRTLGLQIGLGVEFPMSNGVSFVVETSICAAFGKMQVIPFLPAKAGIRFKV